MAIDEIRIGRPREFLTIVLNPVTGAVAFAGEGKGKAALKPLWQAASSLA